MQPAEWSGNFDIVKFCSFQFEGDLSDEKSCREPAFLALFFAEECKNAQYREKRKKLRGIVSILFVCRIAVVLCFCTECKYM